MIQPRPDRAEELTVLGQFLTSKNVLLQRFRGATVVDDLKPLLELDDNYVAAYTSDQHVWIVNSLYSLNSYFYSLAGGVFLHGDTVASVASKGPVDLTWNHEAIADLMALGHLVGDDTLVRGVCPVPQGAVLHWDGTRLTVKRFHRRDLAESVREGDVASNLIDIFLQGLEAGVGARPIATSSSGLDSRVILAGLLHLGMRPELLVMGDPESKDVQVVKQMATAFDLRVNHISLDAREYADRATEICRLTDGMKSVDHWHSYFLGQKSGYSRDDHVMTGNNGEHVRAAGFDYGVLAIGLDHLSRHDNHIISDALLAKYWKMKTHMLLNPDELRQCAPAFVEYYGSRHQTQKFMGVMPPDESFVWQNDAFVIQQRRRTFQACGLRLMSAGFFPYSPYMRKAWVDAAWRLSLSWRLGSRWHRYAVERLYPALLEFPEEKEARHMLRRQRPLAWAPYIKKLYRRPSAVPYMDYKKLLRHKAVVGLVSDHSSALEDFIPRSVVSAIVDEQVRTGSRPRLLAVLASMAVWRASLRVAPVVQRPLGGPPPLGFAETPGAS
jgi:hypothetical protein